MTRARELTGCPATVSSDSKLPTTAPLDRQRRRAWGPVWGGHRARPETAAAVRPFAPPPAARYLYFACCEVIAWKTTRSSSRKACSPTTSGSRRRCARWWCGRSPHVAANGLPGEHHFYLTFRTDHPGVVIPPRLRAQYPQEMTIVLQHQFWDLKMDDEAGLISVGLSFGGVPASLVIPLDAVTGFADPHVRYGLRFRAGRPAADDRRGAGTRAPNRDRTKPRPSDAAGGQPRCVPPPAAAEGLADREHAMNAPMPRPSGFPLFADVPAGTGPHAVEAAADRAACAPRPATARRCCASRPMR